MTGWTSFIAFVAALVWIDELWHQYTDGEQHFVIEVIAMLLTLVFGAWWFAAVWFS